MRNLLHGKGELTMSPQAKAATTRRILRHWQAATPAERADGLAWYARAESEARRLGSTYELTTRHAAGIIAALSPRQRWSTNIAAAERVCAAAHAGLANPPRVGLGPNVAKAWRIANGEDPADVLGGPKVRAFFANITGDHDAVTVDVWASRAAYGRDDAPVPAGRTYERLAENYRRAAALLGIPPRELQAAVWVHVRGEAF